LKYSRVNQESRERITKTLLEGLLEDSETNGFQFGRAADEREKREEDKAAQKRAREQKGKDQAVADENLWLSKVADSDIALDKLLRPELVMCHRLELKKSTGAKKDDIVAVLLPYWEQARAVLANSQAGFVVDI
jgi:hypothetical protein